MSSPGRDLGWQARFAGHVREIAGAALGVDPALVRTAPAAEDWHHNTDYVAATPAGPVRVAARARRHKWAGRCHEFTVRYDRPSGVPSELEKILDGWGDVYVYGFESEPGSDRLFPWLAADLGVFRNYVAGGGWLRLKPNGDGTRLAIFRLADMPPGFVLASDPRLIPRNTSLTTDTTHRKDGQNR